jgi:hypothetical protein
MYLLKCSYVIHDSTAWVQRKYQARGAHTTTVYPVEEIEEETERGTASHRASREREERGGDQHHDHDYNSSRSTVFLLLKIWHFKAN